MVRPREQDSIDPAGAWTQVRRQLGLMAVFAAALAASWQPARALPLPSSVADARAAGIGGAYTALARGPLAPFWNPAGIITAPGVQGALSSDVLGSGGNALLFGGAIVAAGGPAVSWNLAEGSSSRVIQGTFAVALGPGVVAGATVAYEGAALPAGVTLSAGLMAGGDTWSLGATLLGLSAPPFGLSRWPELLLGFSLRTVPAVTVTADLHVLSTGVEIALGGLANLWAVTLRWGLTLGVQGGLECVGAGCDLAVFGQELDIALLVRGADLSLSIVVGLEARIPAWW
jgi:hypothetical protein